MHSKQYRTVIIEPSAIIQHGLIAILEQDLRFKIVGNLQDLNRVDEHLTAMRADLIIINPTIIDLHRRPQLRSILPPSKLIALLYQPINEDIMAQFDGVIDIYDTDSKIIKGLILSIQQPDSIPIINDNSELSDREKEILVSVAQGMINKEIAALHHISIHTVISHRKNISRKIGIKSTSGFVVYALLNNLIDKEQISR